MNSLNNHHVNQFVDILRFSRLRRSQLLNDIGLIFEEESDKELMDTTYNKDEVEHIIKNIKEVVKSFVENEVLNINHMNVLLLQQFCKQAEFWHLNLMANISELENRQLLNNIKQFEEEQFLKNKLIKQPSTGKLEPLINEGPVGILKKEIEDLKKENEILKQDKDKLSGEIEQLNNKNKSSEDKISELDSKIIALNKEIKKIQARKLEKDSKKEEMIKAVGDAIENTKLNNKKSKNDDLDDSQIDIKINNIIEKSKLSDIVKGSKANIDELMKLQNFETQQKIKELTKEVESLKKDLDNKLSQSSPVQNLKRMLIERNNQYKILKNEILNIKFSIQNDSSKVKRAIQEIMLSHYTQPSTFTEHVASAYITLTKDNDSKSSGIVWDKMEEFLSELTKNVPPTIIKIVTHQVKKTDFEEYVQLDEFFECVLNCLLLDDFFDESKLLYSKKDSTMELYKSWTQPSIQEYIPKNIIVELLKKLKYFFDNEIKKQMEPNSLDFRYFQQENVQKNLVQIVDLIKKNLIEKYPYSVQDITSTIAANWIIDIDKTQQALLTLPQPSGISPTTIKLPRKWLMDLTISKEGILYNILKCYIKFINQQQVRSISEQHDELKKRFLIEKLISNIYEYLIKKNYVSLPKFSFSTNFPESEKSRITQIIYKIKGTISDYENSTFCIYNNMISNINDSRTVIKSSNLVQLHYITYPDSYDAYISENLEIYKDPETIELKSKPYAISKRWLEDKNLARKMVQKSYKKKRVKLMIIQYLLQIIQQESKKMNMKKKLLS
eukprot:jgi/Orpsp1_1/1183460/evm.model.c7180000085289.1